MEARERREVRRRAAAATAAGPAHARLPHAEAQLAPLQVHGVDPHPDGLADGDLVLHAVDEAVADARDVHEALRRGAVGQAHLHEGAEGGNVGDRAVQPLLVRDVGEGGEVHVLPPLPAAAAELALDHGEPELAVVPHLADPDLDLLALLQVVVNVVDALVGDAGDVHEAVARGADVHEAAEVPDAPHGARVLRPHLEALDGDGGVPHLLGADGRVLGPAVWILPLDLEGAVAVHLDHLPGVHLPVLREHGLDVVVHLVVLEDGHLLHLLRLDVVGLGAAVRVVPLHLEGAVGVRRRHGAGVPVAVVGRDRLHIITRHVVLEDDDLPDLPRLDVVGLRPAVRVVPPHDVRAVGVGGLDHARVPLLVVRGDRLDLVTGLEPLRRLPSSAGPRQPAPTGHGCCAPSRGRRGAARESGDEAQGHGGEAGGEDGAQQGRARPGGARPRAAQGRQGLLPRH
mmetsp:Transcript_27397/g.85538  ORF Transcript_27397/g.85538 Transcript_27397/m.85538 type:complete len:456 (+) Transcript_27397:416-1783(+)